MKVAGVLLAAGSSSRLGKPKQLLKWHDSFLINHIVNIIRNSKIDGFVIVLGYKKESIEGILEDSHKICFCEKWQKGKSESIKTGLKEISEDYDAVIFFTIDQPFISSQLIDRLIDKAASTGSEIIATRCKNIATIPMVFKKSCIKYLDGLVGEEGGKKIISETKLKTDYVDWKDERILIDIDTETSYQQALQADVDDKCKSNDLL